MQAWGAETGLGDLAELRRQMSEFREVEMARIFSVEYPKRKLHRDRTPEIEYHLASSA